MSLNAGGQIRGIGAEPSLAPALGAEDRGGVGNGARRFHEARGRSLVPYGAIALESWRSPDDARVRRIVGDEHQGLRIGTQQPRIADLHQSLEALSRDWTAR